VRERLPGEDPAAEADAHWREREFERHLQPAGIRSNLGLWAWFARRPAMYRAATRLAIGALGWMGRGKGAFASLPLAGG
jgi:L-lactate dehydrogenase complex protein LldF